MRLTVGFTLMTLGLVACAETPVQPPVVPDPPPTAAVPAVTPEPSPVAPAAKVQAPPEPVRRPAVVLPAPAPPPQPPSLAPDVVIGLDEEQTEILLGKPGEIKAQPPATVWEYRMQGCALDLYFYVDLASQKRKVLTYDLVPPAARNAPDCFGRLRAAARVR